MVKAAKRRNISGKDGILRPPTQKAKKTIEKEVKNSVDTDFEHFQTRQKTEVRRLRKIYKDLPESQKILVSKLLARAAYINSKLESTESQLDQEGMIVDFENGGQVIKRVNPYLKAYMDLLKIYNSLIEQIDDMIRHDRDIARKENHKTAEDPLIDFINAR